VLAFCMRKVHFSVVRRNPAAARAGEEMWQG
jgi:hypothetical protein